MLLEVQSIEYVVADRVVKLEEPEYPQDQTINCLNCQEIPEEMEVNVKSEDTIRESGADMAEFVHIKSEINSLELEDKDNMIITQENRKLDYSMYVVIKINQILGYHGIANSIEIK